MLGVATRRTPKAVTDASVTPRASMTWFIVGRKSGSADMSLLMVQ